MTSLLVISGFEFEYMSLFRSAHFKLHLFKTKMQGFVNHFANHNCVLHKKYHEKGFENVLQIFLRLIRLLTPLPQVKYLSTDVCIGEQGVGLEGGYPPLKKFFMTPS